MKKLLLFLFLFWANHSHAQTFFGQIVTNENDTTNVQISTIRNFDFNVNRLFSLQDSIKVIHNGVAKNYLPKDLKSFKINIDKEVFTFDNCNNMIFAQRLYSGKVKLHKLLRKIYVYPNQNTIRYYIVKKPNDEKYYEMPAMGLSRLITKNKLLPVFSDCKISLDKIENDEVKIKDELILADFVKDYEKNCFQ
jgi:hypothetical protein